MLDFVRKKPFDLPLKDSVRRRQGTHAMNKEGQWLLEAVQPSNPRGLESTPSLASAWHYWRFMVLNKSCDVGSFSGVDFSPIVKAVEKPARRSAFASQEVVPDGETREIPRFRTTVSNRKMGGWSRSQSRGWSPRAQRQERFALACSF